MVSRVCRLFIFVLISRRRLLFLVMNSGKQKTLAWVDSTENVSVPFFLIFISIWSTYASWTRFQFNATTKLVRLGSMSGNCFWDRPLSYQRQWQQVIYKHLTVGNKSERNFWLQVAFWNRRFAFRLSTIFEVRSISFWFCQSS